MTCRFFDTTLPFDHFCWNLLVLSTLSLLPFLMIYVGMTPGFAKMLATNGTALSRFMRQVLTNGLSVVFLINYAGFVATSVYRKHIKRTPIRYIFMDGLVGAILFVGLHTLIYVLSADLFGSFGGDRSTALQVVGPTLQRAWLFENISGVYLYGIVPGALFVYLAARRRVTS
ncbi:MAG: hypothetical protein ACKVLN_07315 [Rhodobacterales bacterium]|jgi:hypothetical protein